MTYETHTGSANQPISDYGIYNGDACDPMLRSRVLQAIQSQNSSGENLTETQLSELVTYITQLEDALLRYHWGAMGHHQINEILKCSTGLDIEARVSALVDMTASDA
jgi:hypothetical protein